MIDRYSDGPVFLGLAVVLLALSIGAAFLPSLHGLDDIDVGDADDVGSGFEASDLDPDWRTAEAERIAAAYADID